MDFKFAFAVLSFLFSAAAYVPYTKSVLKSTARPTLSAWLTWWIMDIAILIGMVEKHKVAPQMVAYVVGCAIVIGACIWRRANLGWKVMDTVCTLFVLIAAVLWVKTGESDAMIVLSVIATVVGCIPLIGNVWKEPHREPMLPWTLILIGGIFGVLAITEVSIAGALTQWVFLTLQLLFFFLILRKFFKVQPC